MAGKRRGPAPEPAAVKKAKGNSGRRPIKTENMEQLVGQVEESTEDSGDIKAPDWVNEEGRKVWDHLVPRLSKLRIFQKIDTLTFARYCQDFGRWIKLSRTLDKEGTTYESESPHGSYKRSHPAFMQADRLNRTLMAMEGGFGLNPADRQRLFAAKAAASIAPDLFNQGEKDEGKEQKSPVGLLN